LLDNALNMIKQSTFKGFFDLPTNLKIKVRKIFISKENWLFSGKEFDFCYFCVQFLTLLIACVDDSDSFHDGVIGLR